MTTLHHEAKASVPGIMYIRGVPFKYPDGAGKDAAASAGVSVPEASVADTKAACRPSAAEVAAKAVRAAGAVPAFIPSNLLARFGTACGCRAGISRGESDAQARIVKSRRSVRVFSERAVPMRLLRDLIGTVAQGLADGREDAARFAMVEAAPTMAKVTRLAASWLRREGILGDGAGPEADAGRTVFGGAPHLAVAFGRSDSVEAAQSCSLAMARLEWAGAAMGLGTCFAGEMVRAAAGSPELAAALSIPTGHTAFAALFIGYPGFGPDQSENAPGVRIIWL